MGNMDDVTAPRRFATFSGCVTTIYLYYISLRRETIAWDPGHSRYWAPKFRERNGVRNCEMRPLKVSGAQVSMKYVWIDRGEVCLDLKGSPGPLRTT